MSSLVCMHVLLYIQLLALAAWLARFGSGLFMVVQMIILLDMTQNWNDDWVSKEDDRYGYHCCSCIMLSEKAIALAQIPSRCLTPLHWLQVPVCSFGCYSWCFCWSHCSDWRVFLLVQSCGCRRLQLQHICYDHDHTSHFGRLLGVPPSPGTTASAQHCLYFAQDQTINCTVQRKALFIKFSLPGSTCKVSFV